MTRWVGRLSFSSSARVGGCEKLTNGSVSMSPGFNTGTLLVSFSFLVVLPNVLRSAFGGRSAGLVSSRLRLRVEVSSSFGDSRDRGSPSLGASRVGVSLSFEETKSMQKSSLGKAKKPENVVVLLHLFRCPLRFLARLIASTTSCSPKTYMSKGDTFCTFWSTPRSDSDLTWATRRGLKVVMGTSDKGNVSSMLSTIHLPRGTGRFT